MVCLTILDTFFLFFYLDLSVGLFNVLTDIIWRITVSWRAGNFACKFIRFIQVSVTYASTYVLVALSIDRYDAITHPMNFSGSCKYYDPLDVHPTCLIEFQLLESIQFSYIKLEKKTKKFFLDIYGLVEFLVPNSISEENQ